MATTAAAESPAMPPRFAFYGIHTIRAHFYYAETGEIDPKDFVGDLVLGNVAEGRGEAKLPTRQTWVVVEIDGPSFAAVSGGSVKLEAREGKALIARQQKKLVAYPSATGKTIHVPFLIEQNGCVEVDLTVTLTPPPEEKFFKAKSSRSETLHFECPSW
jgi:hypothetical protein